MAARTVSAPVVVLLTMEGCGHCTQLKQIWDRCKSAMTAVAPSTRYAQFHHGGASKLDYKKYPKMLNVYGDFMPVTLLIPGAVWDAALADAAANGENSKFVLRSGVVAMNRKWDSDKVTIETEVRKSYNIRKPEEFARWLALSLNDAEFIRQQNGQPAAATGTGRVAAAPAAAAAPVAAPVAAVVKQPHGVIQRVAPARSNALPAVASLGPEEIGSCGARPNYMPRRDA